MSGASLYLQSLPDWFATYAVVSYIVALIGVNIVYSEYATEWYFWVFGIVWVAGFFFLSVKCSRDWSILHVRKSKAFEKKLFGLALALRVLYAIFIHYFYIEMTGYPFEFGFADSEGYADTAKWLVDQWTDGMFIATLTELAETSFSDMGYPLFILLPIKWFDRELALLVIRIIHAVIGAYTVVIIYRIARRSMDETTARIASIFCMLHPVLICYVGITLKETLMTWLLVLFIDMGDRMLRSRNYSFFSIAPMVVLGLLLFLFRTVLGMIAFMAIFFALVMIDSKIVSFGKKIILGTLVVGILLMSASERIMHEVHEITHADVKGQQQTSLEYRYGEKKGGKGFSGNSWAKYTGTTVFAPLIFTIPFPTLVDLGFQQDMRLIHGGNWMRNVMSGFVILAMFMLLLTGDWRRYTLPLALMLGYLVMLAFTQFAHSLRFHIPVMPFEMMFAAYAITNMRKKHRNWYAVWCIVMVVACFAWNWFKLKGRGL